MKKNRTRLVRGVLISPALLFPALALAEPLPVADLGLVPGDLGAFAALNSQADLSIAKGDTTFLAVWTDQRARNSGSQTTQGDSDVFGARLDASGVPIDPAPFLIASGPGYQRRPKAAWNGENWLVMFESQDLMPPPATYWETRVRYVRVAASGQALDPVPLSLPRHQFDPDTIGITVSGVGGTWLIARCLYHNDGYGTYLAGQRVAASGLLLDTTPVMLNDWVYGSLQVVASNGEYLAVGPDWNNGGQLKARRIGANLTPLAPSFNLPANAFQVGTSGSELYVTWISNFTDISGSRMTNTGTLLNPAGTLLFTNFAGDLDIAHDGTGWWLSRTVSNMADLIRLDPAGNRLDPVGGVRLPISVTGSVNSLYDNLIVPRPGGGVLYAWTDLRETGGYDQNAFVMPVSPANTAGAETMISTSTRNQQNSDLALGPAGEAALVYASNVANAGRVLVQRLAADGSPRTPEPVEAASGRYFSAAGIAWNGSRYLVVWSEVGGTPYYRVAARFMNPDGTFAGEAFDVMPGMVASVEALNGNFCVAATRFATYPQFIDLWVKRLDADGNALDPANGVAVSGGYHSGRTRTRSDGTQWLVFSHSHWSHDSSQSDAVMVKVPPTGTPALGNHPTPFSGGTGDPDVAVSESNALLVWRMNSLSNANNYVMGRLMNFDGTFGNAFIIAEAPGRQLRPTVAWDGANYLVAWDDQRRQEQFYDERTSVYAIRVSPTGALVDPGAFALAPHAQGECSPALLATGPERLLAATTRFSVAPPLDSYRIGLARVGASPTCDPDVNADGNVDQSDVAYLVDVVAGGANPTGIDPDFNHDGSADQSDVDALINVVAGGACP